MPFSHPLIVVLVCRRIVARARGEPELRIYIYTRILVNLYRRGLGGSFAEGSLCLVSPYWMKSGR